MINYQDILKATQGEVLQACRHQAESQFCGGSFDTRTLTDEQIFFAWKGKNGDGHDYLDQLAGSSVRLVLVERVPQGLLPDIEYIRVESSLVALQQISQTVVQRFRGGIVAITGSCGKTTAKTWLNAILQSRYKTLCNQGNFNNHIGCPISVLRLRPEHEVLILEMGASGVGEIDALCRLFPPHRAVLLNAGSAHIARFGSREKIFKAKSEIFSHLRSGEPGLGGIAFAPSDDDRFADLHQRIGAEVQYFGDGMTAEPSPDKNQQGQLICWHSPEGEKKFTSPLLGDHVPLVLDAVCKVALSFGLSTAEVLAGMQNLSSLGGRFDLFTGKNGVQVIDDTYNANPESLLNMLRSMAKLPDALPLGKRVAFVGTLAEQDAGLTSVRDVLLEGIPAGIDAYWLEGETAPVLAEIIRQAQPAAQITHIDDLNRFTLPPDLLAPDVLIGVKGSRASRMERLLTQLR